MESGKAEFARIFREDWPFKLLCYIAAECYRIDSARFSPFLKAREPVEEIEENRFNTRNNRQVLGDSGFP
jgi:hypothetical protein